MEEGLHAANLQTVTQVRRQGMGQGVVGRRALWDESVMLTQEKSILMLRQASNRGRQSCWYMSDQTGDLIG